MERKIVEMLQAGHSLREIVGILHVGDRRVRRLRVLAEDHGYLGETPRALPPYPEAVFAWDQSAVPRPSDADVVLQGRREWIVDRLQAGWHPITVFEELGLAVSRSSFYRFLQRHNLQVIGEKIRNRVVPEIVHEPGSALLLDWGKLRDVVDPDTGKKKALWAFVGVLGFSRYLMVRLVWSNDVASTMDAIQVMLREIGGVPKKITSDNPKCFAIEASKYEPLLNPVFERLAAHYGIRTIECLPPADPEKKGKVERPMPYIRRLYEAHGDAWYGLEESQAYLDRKLGIANERKHGTTRQQPIEQLLTVEASALAALPPLAYEPETVSAGVVRGDGHVRFENRYYSLQERFIGEKVVILGSAAQVSIYHQGKLIEVHERLIDPHRSKSTKTEHLKPWERAMQDDSMYRKRARVIGADVERFVTALLMRGHGFIDTRRIWGVLSLDKSYSHDQINEACRQALELDTLSYRMVKSLLRLQPPTKNTESHDDGSTSRVANKSHKFVRPMSVYEEQLELLH